MDARGISTPIAGDYRESRIATSSQLPPLQPRTVLSIQDGIPGYMGFVPGKVAENVFGTSWTNTLNRSLSAHDISEFGRINRPFEMGTYEGDGKLRSGYIFTNDNTMVNYFPLGPEGRPQHQVPRVESDGHREIPVHSSSYMHMRRGTSTCPFTGIHVDYAGRSPGQEGYGLEQPAIGMHVPRYTGFARGTYGENVFGLRNSIQRGLGQHLALKNQQRITQIVFIVLDFCGWKIVLEDRRGHFGSYWCFAWLEVSVSGLYQRIQGCGAVLCATLLSSRGAMSNSGSGDDRRYQANIRSQGWPTSDDSTKSMATQSTGGWRGTFYKDEEEWGKKDTWGTGALNTSVGLSPSEISTVHPSTSVWAPSSVADTSTWSGLLVPDGLRPPTSCSSAWKGYDPVAEFNRMTLEEQAILRHNKVFLSDGVSIGDEEGWLVCTVCEKKTHIIFSVMLPHLQSKKHKHNLLYYEDKGELPVSTKAGLSQASGASESLSEFIVEEADGTYHCTLHKSAVEREAWRREVVSNPDGHGLLRPGVVAKEPDDDALSSFESAMSTASMPPLPPPPSPLNRPSQKTQSLFEMDMRPMYGSNGTGGGFDSVLNLANLKSIRSLPQSCSGGISCGGSVAMPSAEAGLSKDQRVFLAANCILTTDGKRHRDVAAGWLYCELCDKKCNRYEIMLGHVASHGHRAKLAAFSNKVGAGCSKSDGGLPWFIIRSHKGFICTLCGTGYMTAWSLGDHLTSLKHKKVCDRQQLEDTLGVLRTMGRSVATSINTSNGSVWYNKVNKTVKKDVKPTSTTVIVNITLPGGTAGSEAERTLASGSLDGLLDCITIGGSRVKISTEGPRVVIGDDEVPLPEFMCLRSEGHQEKLDKLNQQSTRRASSPPPSIGSVSTTADSPTVTMVSCSHVGPLPGSPTEPALLLPPKPTLPPPGQRLKQRLEEPPLYARNGVMLPPGSVEQRGDDRPVLLSGATTQAVAADVGSDARKEPFKGGANSYPADGPENEPPTEQEAAAQTKKPPPPSSGKRKDEEEEEEQKPSASSWKKSDKWGYSKSSWDMPPGWDPQKDYDSLPKDQKAILEHNFIGLSDGKKYDGLEEGWLYCELCHKKTCISFDIMSVHLQSDKHQRYLRWMQLQSEETRMKAIQDMQLTNSPSKEEIAAAVSSSAGQSGGGGVPVIKQEDLPKFIELRPDCFYCTLCDARPQAWASVEGHIAGQKHRSRCQRAEWEQSGQAAAWYSQISAPPIGGSSSSAASTATPAALPWTAYTSTSTSVSSSSVWQNSQPWQQPRSLPERPLFAPNGRLLPPGFRYARAEAKAKAARAAGPPTRDSFPADDGVLL
ncbi:hypothetical protein FOL47_007012 [Perkinsus chesapeaki]|uniref:C2H2-type domain-containing protein n=1 Tax=Perkinsus chesapeaki TaxID=330153 RepID=A0A7J6MWG2_PERCH|nr:hypothetical protein FOL47_007012 [Perkinsus chesapeaki]